MYSFFNINFNLKYNVYYMISINICDLIVYCVLLLFHLDIMFLFACKTS